MSKISILTIHRCLNFGSVMQAYALKTKLIEISNAQVEVIDYYNDSITAKDYNIIKTQSIKGFINSIVTLPFRLQKRKKFDAFIHTYIVNHEQKTYTRSNISKTNNADLFIVGSDQVWNFDITGKDRTYFLDFVDENDKKASYSSSFGYQEIFDKNIKEIASFLSSFKCVSLREDIGYIDLKRITDKIYIHIDPTMLLRKSEWSKFVKHTDNKYILIYNQLTANNLYKEAQKLSKLTGLELYEICSSPKNILRNPKAKMLFDKSPEECLSLISNAEYVFSTSFHGTVFSILFNKKFFTELNCKEKYNYRVDNLLNTLGLKERAIENIDCTYELPIDWNKVEEKLNAEREKSIAYLKELCDNMLS